MKVDELRFEELANISNVVGSDAGFIVSDNVESGPYLNRDYIESIGHLKVGAPIKIRFTMMLFCMHGEMDVQLNLTSHTLRAGEMLLVNEGTVAMGLSMDPSMRMFIMGFTRGFLDSRPPSRLGSMVFTQLIKSPLIELGTEYMEKFLSVYRVINSCLSRPDFGMKNELVWSGLQMMECLLCDRLQTSAVSDAGMTRKQIITRDFIRLVGAHASSRRDISFYANELCVSTKYLGQVVMEVSGKTPRTWICRQVVLEAKAMLEDPMMTVQQVSEALNFANQSFFGTFFRQHTGMSPKAYRTREH